MNVFNHETIYLDEKVTAERSKLVCSEVFLCGGVTERKRSLCSRKRCTMTLLWDKSKNKRAQGKTILYKTDDD